MTNYIILIKSYLLGFSDICLFEKEYYNLFKNDDKTDYTKKEYDFINGVFSTLDSYCSNPELRDENDLNDEEVKEKISKFYNDYLKN